jgi:hypothetical protein
VENNQIHFNWMKVQNIFSIGDEITFDFNKHTGMNYVFGINKDIDTKNGCGKCVHKSTEIIVSCDFKTFQLFKNITRDVNILNKTGEITQSFEPIIEDQKDKFLVNAKNNSENPKYLKKSFIPKEEEKIEINYKYEFSTHIGSVVQFYSNKNNKKTLKVFTPFGFKTIIDAQQTDKSIPFKIRTFKGKDLICSKMHRVKVNKKFMHVKDLIIGDKIETIHGQERVLKIEQLKRIEPLFDLQVEEVEQYYTNGIISHNSTLFVDAPLFGLFGKTSKKVNKSSIANRVHSKNCYVHINFSINKDEFEIQSGISPTYYKLIKNGKDLTKSSPKETYEYIEREILKSSYLLFKNNIILSVNDSKNIFSMSKDEKRKFIDNLFNLTVVGKMFNVIKKDLNSLDKQFLLEQNSNRSLVNDIAQFNEKIKTFAIEQENQVQKILDQMLDLKNTIASLDCDNEKNIRIKAKLSEGLTQVETKYSEIRDAKNKLNTTVQLLEKDNTNKNSIINKYNNILQLICTDCYKKVDELIGLTTILESKKDNETKINTTTSKISSLLEAEKTLSSKLSEIKDKINEYETKIRDIERNIITKKYKEENYIKLESSIDDIKNKKSPFEDLISKYTNDLNVSNRKIDEYLDQKKYLEFLVFMTSEEGVKKFLISDMINIINSKIRNYLEEMGCEYTALFDPNFDCTFLTITGPCEYDNFSAGERRRIDIAVTFAFKDLLYINGLLLSNILVCDEILDVSIDEHCINSIIKLLKRTAKDQTVYVISHREAVDNSDFDNIIEIQKSGGFTTIIQDEQGEK